VWGYIPNRVVLRQCKQLNNVIEQNHRTVKKRVWLAKAYGTFHQSAWRTLQGIETVKMIQKGRVRWLAKGDAVGQERFIGELFGLSAFPIFTLNRFVMTGVDPSQNLATRPLL
jgi:IS6 family transposase